jgi:hypothetical protein
MLRFRGQLVARKLTEAFLVCAFQDFGCLGDDSATIQQRQLQ